MRIVLSFFFSRVICMQSNSAQIIQSESLKFARIWSSRAWKFAAGKYRRHKFRDWIREKKAEESRAID